MESQCGNVRFWTRPAVMAAVTLASLSLSNGTSLGEGNATTSVYVPILFNSGAPGAPALVFVSRQILGQGSIYWNVPKDQPGVGPHSRFRVAAPGQLLIRKPNGQIRMLVDGSQPTAASLNLIDVNAPDISYDGQTIVFAGLPAGNYNTGPNTNPGAWRLYTINVNGTNLRQVTYPDLNILTQKDGLSANRSLELDGSSQYNDLLWRNAWQAATINPDGTGLAMWSGALRDEAGNHIYGGAFTPSGDLIANFFPMYNLAEAGGFGGLRRYQRGAGSYTPVLGITTLTLNYVHPSSPTSFGIFTGAHATEPEVLADGRLVLSWAADVNQDYGLYQAEADGSGLALLYNRPGTSDVRARAIRARPLPPVLPSASGPAPSLLAPAPT